MKLRLLHQSLLEALHIDYLRPELPGEGITIVDDTGLQVLMAKVKRNKAIIQLVEPNLDPETYDEALVKLNELGFYPIIVNLPPSPGRNEMAAAMRRAINNGTFQRHDHRTIRAVKSPDLDTRLGRPYRPTSGKSPHAIPLRPEDRYLLARAVGRHKIAGAGKRWPALEKAFENRSHLITHPQRGEFVRPRISVFAYMASLNEPWPEGERLIRAYLSNNDRIERWWTSPVFHNIFTYLNKFKIHDPNLIPPIMNLKKNIDDSIAESPYCNKLTNLINTFLANNQTG